MKYILSERQYKLILEQSGNGSQASDYPICVARELSNKNRAVIQKSKSGQYFVTLNRGGFDGYQLYSTGRVMKPDGKMGNYTCEGNSVIVDGVDVAEEAWQKQKGNYTTNWEKQELEKIDNFNVDPHNLMTVLAIGTAFIPVVGPFISAGIGLADAGLYYNEGDKKTAGITAALSMLPFVGSLITKIPGIRQLGVKGMATLASKLGNGGKNLTKAEAEIAKLIGNYSSEIQQELSKMAPKLKNVVKELEAYKPNFVKKYGEQEYNNLLTKYLYNGIEKEKFINTLREVKAPNIRVKPVLGGGADHRVFQSATNPNVIFKAELRPGEVNKWYDTFRKYPKLFAKTIRKVKVKGNNGELLDAVAMEKLDTNSFIKLWDNVESFFYNSQKSLPANQQITNLERLLKNINTNPNYKQVWNNIVQQIEKQSPNISNKVNEFSKMVDELYKVTPNPDLRKFNLGYDANGVLKALDI